MAPERNPELTAFDGVAFRYSDYDTPFWVRPNSEPGRWHKAGEGPTQYLATTVEGAWAELIRAEGLRSEAEVSLIRMPMWVVKVKVQRIADYGTFDKAAEAGFPPEALVEDDYSHCQEEGMRLRLADYQGVLAPSAALPGSTNLTLFGPKVASTWDVQPLLPSSVPASVLAVGAPPEGVVERVRQIGGPHALYEQYVRSSR